MHYRFYTTSTKALGGMLTSINNARESIYLEMYIFENDEMGNDFLNALEQKAHEGVRVVLILDALGSFGITTALIERLKASGAEVLFFSYWLTRTHRKILIIDELFVFLGGVNISGRFALWKDLQVRLSGKHITRSATRSFARVYHKCGGVNPILSAHATVPIFKRATLWFQEHGIGPKHQSLKRYYEEHIARAEHSIILITPYLVPPRSLVAHLHSALLRGVRVEIIVPLHTDHSIIDRVNTHYLDILTLLGARCFQSKIMNHAKVMLIDEREGTIGSNNLDALSFNWNVEASIFFETPTMVHDLMEIIAKWKDESEAYIPNQEAPLPYDFLFRIFLRLFRSIL